MPHFADALVVGKKKSHLERVNALAEKLRFLPHLSEDERVLYAWSLVATPQERWQLSESFLRSVLSSRPCTKRRSNFKSSA
jgi:hypothetical protein